jgi:hypothetical protein
MVKRLVWCLATGVPTALLCYYWRGFPLRLALVGGMSVGFLTYMAVQASERLSRIYRR